MTIEQAMILDLTTCSDEEFNEFLDLMYENLEEVNNINPFKMGVFNND